MWTVCIPDFRSQPRIHWETEAILSTQAYATCPTHKIEARRRFRAPPRRAACRVGMGTASMWTVCIPDFRSRPHTMRGRGDLQSLRTGTPYCEFSYTNCKTKPCPFSNVQNLSLFAYVLMKSEQRPDSGLAVNLTLNADLRTGGAIDSTTCRGSP